MKFLNKHRTLVTLLSFLLMIPIPLVGIFILILVWGWVKWRVWAKIIISIPLVLIVSLQVLGLLFFSAGTPVQILGRAMEPAYRHKAYLATKHLDSDTMIARGDIVVHTVPTDQKVQFIKRVIGMPGETIRIENGTVYINGEVLDESGYIDNSVVTNPGQYAQEGRDIPIPANSYFIMGDNRSRSADSREYGPIPRSAIESVVWFCYWNCGK